ncbi:transketolase [Magnetospirillum sp. 64-120]|uniref:transketolase n=1 Tax=Magnetospirillum sp. 64-120 TaxID=1895778 RepID=UPI0009266940|nr:transketolase [Magnetospirillum sp. 64-120]OJX75924.1 MAG: transketolase [Magnetospirillum sp. 64-120]
MLRNTREADEALRRCLNWRRRILAVSQQVSALHVAPAFSCIEMVDAVYFGLMRNGPDGRPMDAFVMSKGHGVMAQYVMLEHLGILTRGDLDDYCTARGKLGAHPDYGTPGIEASTGSLGHGLGLACGMAYADRIQGSDRVTYCMLGDGEMQEGSVWEAIMMAPNLGLSNLVAFCDFNDFQGLGRTRETHPHFYPLAEKLESFGWEAIDLDGHDWPTVVEAVRNRQGNKPLMVIGRTVKGKGVSYMENVAIWHYRSPNQTEYQQALDELAAAEAGIPA